MTFLMSILGVTLRSSLQNEEIKRRAVIYRHKGRSSWIGDDTQTIQEDTVDISYLHMLLGGGGEKYRIDARVDEQSKHANIGKCSVLIKEKEEKIYVPCESGASKKVTEQFLEILQVSRSVFSYIQFHIIKSQYLVGGRETIQGTNTVRLHLKQCCTLLVIRSLVRSVITIITMLEFWSDVVCWYCILIQAHCTSRKW